ncbi:hypothetical protein K431DRAFT_221498 [Polychaeton citri CBS 116435]|uniref:Caffeine-induced death protein Cid2 n=1 Tax=Polychaeton citri CBS 116435 TaxID=1314669 RepID=A0A9P4QAE0_9PEZI|nr:hypothetical protein K431DRAFT_221498 [Polychaeton citri CBS 116435]
MSGIPEQPSFTPQFCFNQTALRDFLRTSRSLIDDTISQNLNALLTPASQPFDPSSTSSRQPRPLGRHTPISPTACSAFKSRTLFPSWQARSDVLNYCAGVATSPDPDDPQHVLREEEDMRARERLIDERLDPYSSRYFPREARTESLAQLIRNERMVEGIIRSRTWGMVGERCGDDGSSDWDQAFDRWRKETVKGGREGASG